jgi:hypothetical protein
LENSKVGKDEDQTAEDEEMSEVEENDKYTYPLDNPPLPPLSRPSIEDTFGDMDDLVVFPRVKRLAGSREVIGK